jgi:Type I phosphodiesterase / nucleotide pyrophosphatase
MARRILNNRTDGYWAMPPLAPFSNASWSWHSPWCHRQQNIVLCVADGLRSAAVSPETAPTMARIRAQGVDFRNSHSLFPTDTTANASAIATGHFLGDTGDFGN